MLYRYIFRGLGLVLAAGMITAALLSVLSQTSEPTRHDPSGRSTSKEKVRP